MSSIEDANGPVSGPPTSDSYRDLLEDLQDGRELCGYCFHPLRRAPSTEITPSHDFVPDVEKEYAPGRDSHVDTERVLFCPECGREDGAAVAAGDHRSRRELHEAFDRLLDHLLDTGADVDRDAGHAEISECNARDNLAGRDLAVLARAITTAVDVETNR